MGNEGGRERDREGADVLAEKYPVCFHIICKIHNIIFYSLFNYNFKDSYHACVMCMGYM